MGTVHNTKRYTQKSLLHGERTRQKKVYIQKVVTWRGYTTQKGAHPKGSYMEREHDTKGNTQKLNT